MSGLFSATELDTTKVDDIEQIQLVGMKLGDEEYAVDVLKIQEIIRTVEITIVPRTEGYVLGAMNMRGKVIPVIDLRIRFNLERVDFDKSTRIIVVKFDKENVGFVVDEVTAVIRITKNMVEPTPPLVGAVGQEYILGICKYNERLIILLDIDRVVGNAGGMIDSALRQRFTAKKAEPVSIDPEELTLAINEDEAQEDEKENETVTKAQTVEKYSMADEADAMLKDIIQPATAKKDEPNIDDILNDAVAQGQSVTKANNDVAVQQFELDDLIAMELAKREAETDELNRKKRLEKENAEKKNDRNIELESNHNTEKTAVAVDNETVYDPEIADLVEKSSSKERVSSDFTDLDELKAVAKKIIQGEARELDFSVKGEVGTLLQLLMDMKTKVDELSPTVLDSQKEFSSVTNAITDVNETTEKAADNLLSAAQQMSNFYKEIQTSIEHLDNAIKSNDKNAFKQEYDKISTKINDAESLGFHILEALEFQDITEQKLRHVIRSVEEVGTRLGAIVGFLKVQDDKQDKSGKFDKLLTDFGLV